MTRQGLSLQKRKAREVLPDPHRQLQEHGSIMVAPATDALALRREFDLLTEMGCNVEWLAEDEVVAATGKRSGFVCGLRFPNDAIIDSSAYALSLLNAATRIGDVTVSFFCAKQSLNTQ